MASNLEDIVAEELNFDKGKSNIVIKMPKMPLELEFKAFIDVMHTKITNLEMEVECLKQLSSDLRMVVENMSRDLNTVMGEFQYIKEEKEKLEEQAKEKKELEKQLEELQKELNETNAELKRRNRRDGRFELMQLE